MRNIIPVVMAGVLGIYGLIVAVILGGAITEPSKPGVYTFPDNKGIDSGAGGQIKAILVNGAKYSSFAGFAHLAAGLCCGLSGLAAGMAIGIVGDAGVRAVGRQEKLFVIMILILIFAEALGLYGLIVALIMSQKGGDTCLM